MVTAATHQRLTWLERLLPFAFLAGSAAYIHARMGWDEIVRAPGSDARVYVRATEAWLAGGDPYAPVLGRFAFASPPPTLLAVAPLTLLGEQVAVALILGGSVGLAVWTLRRLSLPLWWLLFPPLFESLWLGSLNVVMLALLVASEGAVATAGVALVKMYGLVPPLILGRWRGLIGAAAVLVVTAPFLPWREYLSGGVATIDAQSLGYSAWTTPLLIPPVVVSLIVLGRQRAAWLAVPGLWPYSQAFYGVLALPAIHPIVAVFMCWLHPFAASLGIMCYAILVLVRGQSSLRDVRVPALSRAL